MTLYLTPDERPLYEKLPNDIREKWSSLLAVEDLEVYETEDQLTARFFILGKQYPDFKNNIEMYRQGVEEKKSVHFNVFEGATPEFIDDFLFAMGARGLLILIAELLMGDEPDMELIAHLSEHRHNIFIANSSLIHD